MKRIVIVSLACAMIGMALWPFLAAADGPKPTYGPPVDHQLMGFKEQGVWYFLCTAPVYQYRIPPHYLTFAPPPPPCPPPVMCAPPWAP